MDVDAFFIAARAADLPAILRADAATNQAGPPLLGGVVPEIQPLSGDDSSRLWREAPSSTRARPSACAGACPGSSRSRPVIVRDLARLGRRRPTDRPARGHGRRPGRPVASGPADRLRRDRRLRRRLRGMAAVRSSGGGRTPRRRRLCALAPGGPGGAVRHRRPPAAEYEAGTSQVPSTSAQASCPSGSTPCRATGRSRRSARVAIARASPRRCSVPRFRGCAVRRWPARPGRHAASRRLRRRSGCWLEAAWPARRGSRTSRAAEPTSLPTKLQRAERPRAGPRRAPRPLRPPTRRTRSRPTVAVRRPSAAGRSRAGP